MPDTQPETLRVLTREEFEDLGEKLLAVHNSFPGRQWKQALAHDAALRSRLKEYEDNCLYPHEAQELRSQLASAQEELAYGKRPTYALTGACAESAKRCCVCGDSICTVEECKEHAQGSELTTGEWCCSVECWDIAASDYADYLRKRLAAAVEAQKEAECLVQYSMPWVELTTELWASFFPDKLPSTESSALRENTAAIIQQAVHALRLERDQAIEAREKAEKERRDWQIKASIRYGELEECMRERDEARAEVQKVKESSEEAARVLAEFVPESETYGGHLNSLTIGAGVFVEDLNATIAGLKDQLGRRLRSPERRQLRVRRDR